MNELKFKPEGWENEITKVDKGNIDNYINSKEIIHLEFVFSFWY